MRVLGYLVTRVTISRHLFKIDSPILDVGPSGMSLRYNPFHLLDLVPMHVQVLLSQLRDLLRCPTKASRDVVSFSQWRQKTLLNLEPCFYPPWRTFQPMATGAQELDAQKAFDVVSVIVLPYLVGRVGLALPGARTPIPVRSGSFDPISEPPPLLVGQEEV
jgi:hypothetical protein